MPPAPVLLFEKRRTVPHAAAKKHPAISEETFLELIDAKKDSFYRVAYSYTRHREDALDVVSESVCKAYTHLYHLKDPDSFYPWFYRILSNTALTFIKRHRRFASLEDWDESVTPMEQTAEILAMREELARLEQKYREVFEIQSGSHVPGDRRTDRKK